MNKYLPLYLSLFLVLAMTVVSCNKNNEPGTTEESDYTAYSSSTTLVSAFSLKANSKILDNLDSVMFTIDQDRGLIYNPDSLPYGTRVNAMCVSITSASTVALREFIIENGEKLGDTTITYNTSRSDSIDFTGNVTLRVTSLDGEHTRDYSVKVNVHKEKPDTMIWDSNRRRDLPNVTSTLKASKTIQYEGEFLCLVNDNGNYVLSSSVDPIEGPWSKTTLSFPFVPKVESLTATTDKLFILDDNGTLYTSDDRGQNWSSCGVQWYTMIGAYDKRVLGVKSDGGVWKHDEYPQRDGFESKAIESDFPIEGMSQLVMASNEWTANQQSMIVGGQLADGTLTNIVWGYDGERWGQVSNTNDVVPAIRDASFFTYFTYVIPSGRITPVKRVTWMMLGGKLEGGILNTTTYISRNQCINWSKGETGLQKPDNMPSFYGAQVYSYERTHSANYSPRLLSYNPGQVTPITEWDCPYIYIFGGYAYGGTPLNSVWEGVLRRLTYKPVF